MTQQSGGKKKTIITIIILTILGIGGVIALLPFLGFLAYLGMVGAMVSSPDTYDTIVEAQCDGFSVRIANHGVSRGTGGMYYTPVLLYEKDGQVREVANLKKGIGSLSHLGPQKTLVLVKSAGNDQLQKVFDVRRKEPITSSDTELVNIQVNSLLFSEEEFDNISACVATNFPKVTKPYQIAAMFYRDVSVTPIEVSTPFSCTDDHQTSLTLNIDSEYVHGKFLVTKVDGSSMFSRTVVGYIDEDRAFNLLSISEIEMGKWKSDIEKQKALTSVQKINENLLSILPTCVNEYGTAFMDLYSMKQTDSN